MSIYTELRQKVGTGATTFEHADSLIYLKSHINVIDGLFENDTVAEGIKLSLLPNVAFGGMRPMTPLAANVGTDALGTSFESQIATNETPIGCFARATAAITITVDSGDTVHGDDADGDYAMEIGDWIICVEGTYGTADKTFAILNNVHGPVSDTEDGLMTIALKTKLDGITPGANAYVHPTPGSITENHGGINFMSDIVVSSLGHVESVTFENIQSALTSRAGVVQLSNATASSSDTLAATPAAVNTVRGLLNTHEGETNPHSISKTTFGLDDVINQAMASIQEAQEGTLSTRYMSPERVVETIGALGGVPLLANVAAANTEGAKLVTESGYFEAGKVVLVQVTP